MDSELERGDLTVSESFDGRDSYKIAARPNFYTEQFERVCPYYISFGMSYEQFWDGDVEIAKAMRKAHEIKLEQENYIAWLHGRYIYDAVGALSPALRAFSKGKVQPYHKEPYGAAEKRLEQAKTEDEKHKVEDQKFEAYMTAWMSSVNKKFAKEGEKTSAGCQDERN